MIRTLALDVYGTLVDPLGIATALEGLVGADAERFAAAWRDKQIEYLFRRGLGRRYEPFSTCTRQALDYTCTALGQDLDRGSRDALMDRYLELPAYPGTDRALDDLRAAGYRCFAFSNGEPGDLRILLERAGLGAKLDGIVSAHEVRSFKPDPAVYGHFLENTGSMLGATWLVSGNPFDVIGALEVGWKAAWLRREPAAQFDPWGIEPSVVVASLGDLPAALP